MLEEFHFIRPLWLLILPIAGLIVWLWYRRTQGGSGWIGQVDAPLLDALIDSSHVRSGRLLLSAMLLSTVVGSVGMAGPTWQKLPQDVEQKQDALIILLDLSLSMLAEDVKPSRLERARQKVADVLRLREEGETALIAYAGDAHAVVPLTDDVATIENLLFSLSPEMMPVFGSNPNHALELAEELFSNSAYLQGRLLMITDGIDDISSVSRHRSAAFPISVLGIGTEDGAPIPLDRLRQPGRFLLTQEGNQVVALLDEQRLGEVAAMTYGKYHRAQVGDQDILHALSTALPAEDETIEVEREFDTWSDQGHWLALLLVPLVLLSFRKGVFICLAVLMLPTTNSHAAEAVPTQSPEPPTSYGWIDDAWQSLWQRADQRGVSKLRHGQPEQAAVLFEDPQWRASAQYRSGDYASAMQGFSSDQSSGGFYNQGNTLARLGEYEGALEAYDKTLATIPDHEDALFNKEIVERLLEEKQQAEQQQQDQQDQANNEEAENQQDQQQQDQQQQDNQEQQEAEDQQQQEQEQQTEQQDAEEQQAEQMEDQASRDEKQEALEQWLRRVPDDPGGLLRRKFSHETRQRLRRGEYDNRQGEKQW